MTPYKGFQIDSIHRIYKNGRHIFTAHWQTCYSLQDAKDTIDYSLEQKQREVQALPDLGKLWEEEMENGSEAAEDFSNWMDTEAERQLNDHEANY